MSRVSLILLSLSLGIASISLGSSYPDAPEIQVRDRIQADFSDSNTVHIQGKLVNGTPVEITIRRTECTSETFPYSTDIPQFEWTGWGTAGVYRPRTVITAVNVWAGEHPLYVNLSAYSDLANARNVLFEDLTPWFDVKSSDGEYEYQIGDYPAFRIIITGSDAAGSYSAELYFNDRTIERRVVFGGEFRSTQREETTYTYVDWGRRWRN